MLPSREEAVRIYVAARAAFYAAAREVAPHIDDSFDPEIAERMMAAAGLAAFEECRALSVTDYGENLLLAVQVTDSPTGVEYCVGASPMPVSHFGLIVADIVRQGAKALNMDAEEAWNWVERERHHPTTDIRPLMECAN